MARQKGQVLLFNDAELSLIKNTFAENEDALYLIRNVLLQFEITKEERKLLKGLMTPAVFEVVKKRIFPVIDSDAPMFQLSDMYQTLTTDMKTKGVEDMAALFDAKQLQVDYLDQQFKVLQDLDKKVVEVIRLDDLASLKNKSPHQMYVDTAARNYLLSHVDTFLNHIKTLAGQKSETLDEVKKRLTRDSAK